MSTPLLFRGDDDIIEIDWPGVGHTMNELPPEVRAMIFDYFDCPARTGDWQSLRLTCRQWRDETRRFSADHLTPDQAFYSAAVVATHSRTIGEEDIIKILYGSSMWWSRVSLSVALPRANIKRHQWNSIVIDCIKFRWYIAALNFINAAYDLRGIVIDLAMVILMSAPDSLGCDVARNPEHHIYRASSTILLYAAAHAVSKRCRDTAQKVLKEAMQNYRPLFMMVVSTLMVMPALMPRTISHFLANLTDDEMRRMRKEGCEEIISEVLSSFDR